MSRSNKTKYIPPGPKALEGLKIRKLAEGIYSDRTGIITGTTNCDSKSPDKMRIIILWDTDEVIGIDKNGKLIIEYDDGVGNISARDLVNKDKYLVYSRY